ncbi:MAG TPA: tetratricopeptide repeat protein [Anaerolineales bacterium]|nr:tetratricopeptide repeat protein [Anaerolineales bacterium]
MSKRKAILFLLSVIAILVYSQFNRSDVDATGLPPAKDIKGDMLVNIPPVKDAIQSFESRVRQHPKDAVSYTLLGELYIRQARETGDVAGYQRAELALNKALELLPGYSPAGSALASVYYAQHEFEQALDLAGRVYESNPKNASALVIMGDAYLSLGNYQKAEEIYQQLGEIDAAPPMLARLAHLAELNGNPDEALQLMRRAAANALHSEGTRENVAWYLLRVADVYFNMGKIDEAGDYYEASLRVFDDYHLALAGLGKVRAAEGKYDEAIAHYKRAVEIVPQPEFLAALGDLYLITGQPEEAQFQYDTVELIGKLAALNQQIYNRQLANFYSDHDLKLDEALELALAELESRKDIYGYDAAAWAYYKNGNYKAAQSLMDQAMALGTRDALLFYHAGMIAQARADNEQARNLLQQALTINPHFSLLNAVDAQRTLEGLKTVKSK